MAVGGVAFIAVSLRSKSAASTTQDTATKTIIRYYAILLILFLASLRMLSAYKMPYQMGLNGMRSIRFESNARHG